MDNLLSERLDSAITREEASPAFKVHNLEFMVGTGGAGHVLGVLKVGPKTLRFVDLSVWFQMAHTVMHYYDMHVPLHLGHSADEQLCLTAISVGLDSVVWFAEWNVAVAGVTQGSRRCLMRASAMGIHVQASTGAGDVFHGAFWQRLLDREISIQPLDGRRQRAASRR